MRPSGGRAAWAVLARGRGRVLAAFRACVYLDAAGRLCCVGGERLVEGPLNLRLRGDAGLPALLARCASGTPWHCRGSELVLGDGPGVSLRQPVLWRAPRPAAAAPELLSRALPSCRAALRAHSADTDTPWRGVDAGAARAGIAHRLHHALAAGTHALARWLDDALGPRAAAAAQVPPQLLALLGCGRGLTPSGDDVLAGTLVTLHAFVRPDLARLLSRAIAHQAPLSTGRISAAHLAAAGDGEAVAPVHALLEALRSGDPDASAACASALLGHGESSGADALAGIVLTASALVRSRHHAASDARCARRVAPASSSGYITSASSSGSR